MQKNCRFLIPKAALHIEVEGEAGIWSWGQYHKAYRKAFGGKEGRAHTSWLVVSPQEWSVTCKQDGSEVIWKEELKGKCLGRSAKPHLNSSVNNSALRSNLSLPHAALGWKTSKKEEKNILQWVLERAGLFSMQLTTTFTVPGYLLQFLFNPQ